MLDFIRFAELFPDAMLLVDRNGTILAFNSATTDRLGYEREALTSRRISDLSETSSADIAAYLRQCAHTRKLLPGAITFRHREGQLLEFRCDAGLYEASANEGLRTILLRLTPKEASSSRFVLLNEQIASLSKEISRRKAVEAALDEQREWLAVTLQSIGDAVIATDLDAKIVFMNGVAQQLTGWTQEEVAGRHLLEVFNIVNEDTRKLVENPIEKVLRDGVIAGLANHTILISRDGTEMPIDDAGAPIRDGSGKLIGAVLVFREIRERRKLETELRQRASELESAARDKDRFLAMLSHELRNPLAPLRNGLILLGSSGNRSNKARLLDIMKHQVELLTHLVNDLLDVSRGVGGKIRLRKAPVNLNLVISRAVNAVVTAIAERNQRLTVDVPGELWTLADETRLEQVFVNLLNNASKFTDSSGFITIACVQESGYANVEIADSGIGMSGDLLPRVFELFSQADQSLDRAQGGLGVGLALVKSLVELHGGDVSATSAGPGKGSAFTVRLPLCAAPVIDGPAPRVQVSPGETLVRKVLVVDDNREAADTLCALMSIWGCEAKAIYDARQVYSAIEAFGPGAIVMDIGLPGISGYVLARTIRERLGTAIRLIALTGYGAEEDKRLAKEAGFNHHLTKPADLDVLQGLLNE